MQKSNISEAKSRHDSYSLSRDYEAVGISIRRDEVRIHSAVECDFSCAEENEEFLGRRSQRREVSFIGGDEKLHGKPFALHFPIETLTASLGTYMWFERSE